MPARAPNGLSKYLHSLTLLPFILMLITLNAFASESVLNFADHLYKRKDYYRAITEYQRYQFKNPKSPRHNQVQFQIGFSYLKGNKWDAAMPYFQDLALNQTNTSLGQQAQFALGHTHFLAKRFKFAIHEWDQFLKKYPRDTLVSKVRYQKAWALLYQEKIPESQSVLRQIKRMDPVPAKAGIKPGDDLRANASKLSQEISTWSELPHRSPFLAGTLSALLPGSGQWYTGRFWDGTSALVLNSMFGYGIYATFRDKHYVAAGIVTFLATGFYGGNIFSAVSSAHKFNLKAKQNTWKRLQNKYGLQVKWTGTGLSLSF